MTVRKRIEQLLMFLCIISLSFIIVIVFINIFFRYFLSGSLGWPQELSTHIIVWTTYTGIGIGISRKELLKIDVFFQKFNPGVQKILILVNEVVMMMVLLYLARFFLKLYSIQSNRFLASMNVPQSIGISGAILATVFLLILLLLNIKDYLIELRKE